MSYTAACRGLLPLPPGEGRGEGCPRSLALTPTLSQGERESYGPFSQWERKAEEGR